MTKDLKYTVIWKVRIGKVCNTR